MKPKENVDFKYYKFYIDFNMDFLIIIIGGIILLYTLKTLRDVTYYFIFLNSELAIVWVLIWWVMGFLITLASTLYRTNLLGLQIVELGSVIFFISSVVKKMPAIKAEYNTIVHRRLQESGIVDYRIPHAKTYYKVGIIGFEVTAIITWIVLYGTRTV